MSDREVKPGGRALTDPLAAQGPAPDRPGVTTLVQREARPVPSTLRARLEAATGASLAGVEIHTGPEAHAKAAAHGARALTIGQNIYFGEGEVLDGDAGEKLIAHEVAHTVQNAKAAGAPGAGANTTTPEDAGEKEASRFADDIVGGRAPAPIVESLGGAIARDVLATADELNKKPRAPDQFSGPITWSVLGDSFSVDIYRHAEDLVVDMRYLGMYPVDSFQGAGKAEPVRRQKVITRRRHPPDSRKDLPYITKLVARTATTLTFDLFGDAMELLVIRDECDPPDLAKFDRRTHLMDVAINGFPADVTWFEVHLPTGDGKGGAEGDREAIATRKIKLLEDEFTLRARRHGDADGVVVSLSNALGEHQVVVPAKIDPSKRLAIDLVKDDGRTLVLDLDCDGKPDATLIHTMRQYPPPGTGRYRGGYLGGIGNDIDFQEPDPYYVHEVAAYDLGGVLLGRMTQKMPGYPGAIPPGQDAIKTPAPAGAAQPATKAPQQEDLLPGQVPEAIQSSGRDWELRVDGDGDRTMELLLRFIPAQPNEYGKPQKFTLRATQLSSGVTGEGDFVLTAEQAASMNALGPRLTRAADGHTFGAIDLGGGIMAFGKPNGLTNAPEGHTLYDFYIGSARISFTPPYEKDSSAPVLQDADKGAIPTKNVGGVFTMDIGLTEYRDTFRITAQKADSDWVLFGLSAVQDGNQIGGIHTRLIGVDNPRLKEFSVTPDKASFIVDPKDAMELLHINSALDPPLDPQKKPIVGMPPTSHRDHRITVSGKGVLGDIATTFPVRYGKFVPLGWEKDKDAQVAAGSADAVGVLQEQAKHPHLAEYKVQIDAALDSAITNAVNQKYLTAEDAANWTDLRTSMVVISAQASSGTDVSTTDVATAEKSVAQLDQWLELETNQAENYDWRVTSMRRTAPGDPGPSMKYSGTAVNPYTGQKFALKDNELGDEKDNSTTHGRLVKNTLEGQQWTNAVSHYGHFREGVRKWLKTRYERDAAKKGADTKSAEAAQLDYVAKMAEETDKLDAIQSTRIVLDNSIDVEIAAAADKGVVRPDLKGTWKQLREDMVLLSAQASGDQPDKVMVARGVMNTGALVTWLAMETADRTYTFGGGKANAYTGATQMKVDDEWVDVSLGHGAKVSEYLLAGQMQLAGQAYNRLRDGVARWVVKKYQTDPKHMDAAAAARLDGLQKQRRSKRDVMRVAAVYQADESFEKMPDADGYKQADFGKYKTVPLTVFVWAEDGKWHIRDVTNPERVWKPDGDVDFNDEDQPPEALFRQLDHSKHLPKGHISYQLPDGTGNRIRLESKKPWYEYVREWAMYIGLAALAVLAIAATFGAAAAVAVPVFVAATASSVMSVAANIGELVDNSQNNFLDNEEIFMNVLDTAVNVASIGAGGAGKLAMGAKTAALAEKQGAGVAWSGMKAFAGKAGSMLYKPLMGTAIAGNMLSALVMSEAMVAQLSETDKIPDPWDRLKARAKLIATWAATSSMVILSLRGDLPSFGKGAPKIVLDNVDGRMVARLGDVHVGKTVVDLPSGNKNLNEHAGARWQADELEQTARSGKGDAKADAQAALDDANFQKWYAKWLEDPKRIGGDGKVRVPADTPPGFMERAQAIVDRGDAKLHQQAFDTADEVATLRAKADELGLDVNPNNDSWKGAREKLQNNLEGEWGKQRTRAALDRYESARLGAAGDAADFVAQRAKIDRVLPETEIERIRRLYPGQEVHVTGDLTSPQAKAGKGTNAVEIAVVVPNTTDADEIIAMERRAIGHKVVPDPEFSKATGKDSLELRVKVMTEDQFFGMATASRKGKPAPTYVRIDEDVSAAIDAGVPVRAQSPTHYAVESDRLLQAREHMAANQTADGRVGKLQYDPKTNSVFFDVHGGKVGNRIRIEAPLPPKITTASDLAHTNRIIGEPVKAGDGYDILRKVNDGDLTALDKTGVSAAGAHGQLPPGTEFGLGELPNGDMVIIRGQLGAVDWSNFPGVKPLAHTHPDIKGNNLQGVDHITVAELGTPSPDGKPPSINRAVVFPTAEDLMVNLQRKVPLHRVVTPFHVREGQVFKPGGANGSGHPLDFEIRNVEEVGTLPSGERVYKATVTGVAGGERVMPARETWGVVDPAGHNSYIDLRPPAGMIPLEVPAPRTSVKAPDAPAPKAPKIDVESVGKAELERQGVSDKVSFPESLSPEAFEQKFKSAKGRAVFVVEPNGETKIYTRHDARRIDVLAEVHHAKQMMDPAMAGEIRMLHGPDLEKNWTQMAAADRLEHFKRKLNIEIDSHEGMLGDVAGADKAEVRGQLEDLRDLRRRAEAITPTQLAEMNAGLRKMEPYLEDPAWLFSKKRGERGAAHPEAKIDHPRDEKGMQLFPDGPERSAAFTNLKDVESVHQIGTEWQEHWQITSGYDGHCTAVTANAKGGTTVEITTKSQTKHYYDLEPGSQITVEPNTGVEIKRGMPLGNEPARRYRYVEIGFKDKRGATRTDRRQEIRTADGEWVQRGSESTNRGKAMEEAAKAQADEGLAKRAEAAKAKGNYFDSHRLEYPQGSGGFDDVLVEFTSSEKKPKAKVRVREVKDYPNRHVPLEDFTAILPPGQGGNLDTNMGTLRRLVDEEMARLELPGNEALDPSGPFSKMSREQVFALGDAIRKNQIDFEVVLGPDTLLGREGARGATVIDSLRTELKGFFGGKDVLKRAGGKYSPEKVDKATAAKFKPAPDADIPEPDDP